MQDFNQELALIKTQIVDLRTRNEVEAPEESGRNSILQNVGGSQTRIIEKDIISALQNSNIELQRVNEDIRSQLKNNEKKNIKLYQKNNLLEE